MTDAQSTDHTSETALFAVKDAREAIHVYQPVLLSEPPEWSPFLPVPGVYDHPIYGEMDLTASTYERIIANFKAGVYQDKLPVNAEHDPQAAGAVGWIVDMRLAESGAIEVQVEWNDRGRALIEGDRFKYVSAEWMTRWSDPVEPEKTYKDVAVGLALTTHPYFKERVLPPLVASEAVLTFASTGEEVVMSETAEGTQDTPQVDEQVTQEAQETVTVDAETVTQLSDRLIAQMTAQLGEKPNISDPVVAQLAERTARELAEAQLARKTAEEANTRLLAENAALREQNRVKTFSDEVLGKGKENGTAWVGDIADHVKMTLRLAEKFGEDSWEFRHWVATNRSHAEQIKAGSLFREIGSGRTNDRTGAYDKIVQLAEARAKEKNETFEQAFDAVLTSDHELRAQYAREQRG